MEMQGCWSCGRSLPERAIFCPQCAVQVRCKACRETLERNARACVACGTLVGESGDPPSGGAAGVGQAINTLELVETNDRRSLRVSCTDAAADSLRDTIGLLIAGRFGTPVGEYRLPLGGEMPADQQKQVLPGPGQALNGEGGAQAAVPTLAPAAPQETETDRLRRVFRHDGQQLRLANSQLKATSRLDAARRVVYLFLYAGELEEREKVPRAELNAVLKDAGLFDTNSSHWISTSADLLVEGSEVGLRLPGREKARKVLNEVFDPAIPNAWALGAPAQERRVRPNPTDGGGAKRSGRASRQGTVSRLTKKTDGWFSAWRERGLPVNGHALLTGLANVDKAIFGLWAIRRAVGDDGKIVTRGELRTFLYKAFEVRVDDRTLSRALESKTARDKVLKVASNKYQYQITQSGMRYAEQLTSASPGTPPAAASSNGSAGTSP